LYSNTIISLRIHTPKLSIWQAKWFGYFRGAMEVARNVIYCLVESVCKMWCGVNFVCYALVFSKIRGLRSGLCVPGH